MMKKLFLLLFIFTFVGCVDKDFDLSKVDDSDIVVGDEFVAPIGTITVKYSEIANFSPSKAAILDFTIPETFDMSYSLNCGFDQGIIDQITDGGKQIVIITVKHKLPNLKFGLKLSFDVAGVLYEGDTKEGIRIEIDKTRLQQIADSKSISLEFTASGDRNISIDLDGDAITVDLVLYRKGGIKL